MVVAFENPCDENLWLKTVRNENTEVVEGGQMLQTYHTKREERAQA